jgi:hypothetical protein
MHWVSFFILLLRYIIMGLFSAMALMTASPFAVWPLILGLSSAVSAGMAILDVLLPHAQPSNS